MIIAAAFIGLLVGHLLDLLLDRFYSEAAIAGPLYRCGACRARADGLYALPVLGYIWHRGRCRACGAIIPRRALFLPLGGAIVFALALLSIEETGPALLAGFFASLFLALLVTDLERRLIPNRIVYPALLLASAFSWAWPDRSVASAFAGGGTALALTLLMYILARGGFGFGDVKMSALMGLVVGLPAVLVGLFFAAISAGALVALLMSARILRRGDYIPYGPFIALGGIIALLWGQTIVDWYMA